MGVLPGALSVMMMELTIDNLLSVQRAGLSKIRAAPFNAQEQSSENNTRASANIAYSVEK